MRTIQITLDDELVATVDQIVKKLKTTRSKIESNVVVKPSVQTVAQIAKSLGVPMEDLLK